MQIKQLNAREILDSRGQPTIEVDVILENHIAGAASVPSGASTGQFEALELRDKDMNRFHGKGVLKAIANVLGPISKTLVGHHFDSQASLDKALIDLDATPDKSYLGANAILAVSLAFARARAAFMQKPLFRTLLEDTNYLMPVPLMNILNGGAHANNSLDIQEFMIMPVGATDFPQSIEWGASIIQSLKNILEKKGLSTAVGDEGGFAPQLTSHQEALDCILKSIELAGLRPGMDVYLALDVAASEWYQNDLYRMPKSQLELTRDDLVNYYFDLCRNYPILSIEDGLAETDWLGWTALTHHLGGQVQLVGDDLFVTNSNRLKQGIDAGVANAILIKPNQIGTLSETLETMALAKKSHYQSIVSHRSGETEDSFIADLAVGTGCGQIKTGSLCRTDRICKYNQLLRIAQSETIPYAGINTLTNFIR